jgi:hypothetical protein
VANPSGGTVIRHYPTDLQAEVQMNHSNDRILPKASSQQEAECIESEGSMSHLSSIPPHPPVGHLVKRLGDLIGKALAQDSPDNQCLED